MRLHEYQAKMIFARHGMPVPKGRLALTASEVKQTAEELGGRVVLKAQVLVGGRGKAGGIRLAKTPKEAEELATQILGMDIKNLSVRKILVDEAVNIQSELYLGLTIDRSVAKPVLIACAEGGVDIEDVARNDPAKVIKIYIDPLIGLREYQARDLAISLDLPRAYWRPFLDIIRSLWEIFNTYDATLTEINPLVITADQRLLALDGKMIVDDNALFRHTDIADLRDLDAEDPIEVAARKYGLSYIKLGGEIGCMVNGAGLAMATMDVIKLCGGTPANFLDIGGGAGAEKVAAAFRLILSDPNVTAVLVNIFGGITRCDEVARGILTALEEAKPKIPIIVRLVGTNDAEGLKLLSQANLPVAQTLIEASKMVVAASGGGAK
jgi:succinyl-CoA synthetase beta subunit